MIRSRKNAGSEGWQQLAEQANGLRLACAHPLVRLLTDAERTRFLNLERFPARLTTQQAAWRLGMTREELAIISHPEIIQRVIASLQEYGESAADVLPAGQCLMFVGDPNQTAVKYFQETQVRKVEQNEIWLDKALRTIRIYWRIKKGQPPKPGLKRTPLPDKDTNDPAK